MADQDGRVVVTKDADFRNSHLLAFTLSQYVELRRSAVIAHPHAGS